MKTSRYGKQLMVAALALCACLLATPSFADTTYTYTGNTLFGNACNGCTVDGSFSVTAPLGSNFSASFQPESYSFSVDGFTFNNSNSSDNGGFYIMTNASGYITSWIIDLTNSSGAVFTADTFIGGADIFTDNQGRKSTGDINVDNAGDWTPSGTATPEPSSMLLLSSGLFGLGFLKRKAVQS